MKGGWRPRCASSKGEAKGRQCRCGEVAHGLLTPPTKTHESVDTRVTWVTRAAEVGGTGADTETCRQPDRQRRGHGSENRVACLRYSLL